MSLSKLEKNILEFLNKNTENSYKTSQIADHFNYQGSKNYKKLVKALAFLERVGEISLSEDGRYSALNIPDEVVGTFSANAKGYGFVRVDADQPDLFIPPKRTGEAMDGDTVEVKIIRKVNPKTGKGSEGQIAKVVERAATQLVGEFSAYDQEERDKKGYLGYIVPNTDTTAKLSVYVLPEGIHPVDRSVCVVEIKEYPSAERPTELTGLVTKEIGHRDEPGVDILSVLYQLGIPHVFPDEVKKEAEQIPDKIDASEMEGRKDLRNLPFITIDGADAKDLDDAITVSRNQDGTYQLIVSIADVSHYVTKGSAIDEEAYERGTSVYLTDRVVPMIPQRLSNGICSLNPNEDRLTTTCEMRIDSKGKVLDYDIYLSVINSKHRMTYTDVNAILDGDKALREEYDDIVPMLEDMGELHKILLNMRNRRGAINFDSNEAQIIVDEKGHPTDIVLRERGVGERAIESFMLAANETVARHFKQKDYPFIYRIHETPDEDRINRFAEFVTAFGMVLRGNTADITPKQLQNVLDNVKDEPYEEVMSMMLLRSMQQAKYSDDPAGHFGLAATDYTHFTSPIRRYPDLIVHRLIHTYLKGRPSQKVLSDIESELPDIAESTSKAERRAVDAERETDAMKKAEYMEDKIGEQYEGRISSITSFGIFIQLPNTVEGLVTLSKLNDDYYQYNPDHLVLTGERTGKVYRIGQQVTIEVEKVDVEEREIDFRLISVESEDEETQKSTTNQQASQSRKKPKDHKQSKKKNNQGQNNGKNKNKNKNKKKQKSHNFTLRKRK